MHFSSVTNRVSSFKADFRAIQAKLSQWERTARAYRVQEVEKNPCNIGFVDMGCDAYASNATQKEIRPYFVVTNYKHRCEIRVRQHFYDRPINYNVWVLTSSDIASLINVSLTNYNCLKDW